MKLEVGMYVRTKRDGIGKIISLSIGEEDECCFIELSNRRTGIKWHNIVKEPSYNIIDLIEVGDYVNGYKIERVDEPCQLNPYGSVKFRIDGNYDYEEILGNEIKTIVTKEQFEAMAYKVV